MDLESRHYYGTVQIVVGRLFDETTIVKKVSNTTSLVNFVSLAEIIHTVAVWGNDRHVSCHSK